ncbi:hypothetical protein ACHAQH_009637 [Verticillium albo-atrum]
MAKFQYDYGTYDPAAGTKLISAGHQTLMYGLEVGLVFIGSILSGFFAMRWGRKAGLYCSAAAALLSVGIQMISHYPAMVVGRAIMGCGIGFAASFSIAYWSEIAPAHLRGQIMILYQLSINISNFLGSCVDQGTHNLTTAWAYRAPLLAMTLPSLIMFGTVWIVPESPRWLVTQNQHERAGANLKKIRGSKYTAEEVNEEIQEAIRFTALEREFGASTSFVECFKGTDLRRTLIATMALVGQQFMGVAFLAGYITYFFALVGFTNAFVCTVIVNAISIVGSLVAFPLVKHIGRRPLMIAGAFVSAFCMLGFATVAEGAPNSDAAAKCIIVFICIFSFAYSATWGALGPAIIGEVPSNSLRSKTIAIAASASFSVSLIVITTIPYLIGASYADLGTRVGFIFGGLTVLVFIGVIIYLPETKDRTLEEIDEMFINRVPTWDFKDYVCTGQLHGHSLDFETDKPVATHVDEDAGGADDKAQKV